jgi:hypothetical protein
MARAKRATGVGGLGPPGRRAYEGPSEASHGGSGGLAPRKKSRLGFMQVLTVSTVRNWLVRLRSGGGFAQAV